MNYIIIDLEWNQPLSTQSQVYRQVGDRLLFDMIQIGAARVTEDFRVQETLSIPIRPQTYMRIHPRIRRMTGLGAAELADALTFQQAMEQFTQWCGEDCVLLTWGCDDISVWKQNMDFYGWEQPLPPMYDIQRLFSAVQQCKDRKGLKPAMELMGIEEEENRAFHNAEHDAYYTAQVFVHLPEPGKVLDYPEQARPLIRQKQEEDVPASHVYDGVLAALASDEALKPRCPVCGKPARLEEEGYVRQTPDKYIGLARCSHHGWSMNRLQLLARQDGKCGLKMRSVRATPSNRAYVHTKRLQMQQKDAEWLERYGALPDPDEALRQAERTSMPFDD